MHERFWKKQFCACIKLLTPTLLNLNGAPLKKPLDLLMNTRLLIGLRHSDCPS